jgi:hypothetical protein
MKNKKQDRIAGMLSRRNLKKIEALRAYVKEIINGKNEQMLKAS